MNDAVSSPAMDIVDKERRIVDAHHHLFVRPSMRYLADEFGTDLAAGHRVIASVFVEANAYRRTSGPEWLRPLGEVEFANGIGAMAAGGYFDGRLPCAGIVGHADLRWGDDLDRLLDRMQAAAPDRFRGIRQLAMDHAEDGPFSHMALRPPRGLLRDHRFHDGLDRLARRGHSFDLAVYHEQFDDVVALADAHPDLTLVLNHMGMIYGADVDAAKREERRRSWAAGLPRLAERANVVSKIGGLGMAFWGLQYDADLPRHQALARAWGPYIEPTIAAFGASRCMMESNFPIDRSSGDYATVWNALKQSVSSASDDEKDALFSGTAIETYKLDLA